MEDIKQSLSAKSNDLDPNSAKSKQDDAKKALAKGKK
jgi:hypothetical protein